MGLFNSLKNKFSKTTTELSNSFEKIFVHKKLNDEMLQELEDTLIQADIGINNAIEIVEQLRAEKFAKDVTIEEVKEFLSQKLIEKLDGFEQTIDFNSQNPFVLLMIGVNGAGKTTTIGKLSQKLKNEGKKVLLIAADTFRAGAVEQLNVWAERTSTDIFKPENEKADPSATIYKGLEFARESDYDVIIIDTAGRLQNRQDLMAQLDKMLKTIKKQIPEAPHSSMLIIDSTVGQNGLMQAELFKKSAEISHLSITKLDSSAKAGCLIGIVDEYKIPVSYIGVGESIEDLKDFNAKNFVNSLLDNVKE
ncbi:MAG TPA: signal recognition particle-docking protein FtsY [Alphaproteobacteria bacterium]|nr:signal recognition particle-docking protein FtsY [Alphaproteobacteria bacterium]